MDRRAFVRRGLAAMTMTRVLPSWSPGLTARLPVALGAGLRPVPAPPIAGLVAWWHPADVIVVDGVRPSSLRARAGSLGTVAQSDVNRRPIYDADGLNGRPALVFDAARGDALVTDTLSALPEPCTVALVCRTPSAAPAANRYLFGATSTQRRDVLITTAMRFGYAAVASGSNTPALPGLLPVVVIAVFDGADSVIGANAVEVTGDVGTGTAPTAFTIGNRGTLAQGFDGPIGQVLVYDKALNARERAKVVGYLAQEYGIELARPAVYYVDAVAGNDAGTGRLPADPFKTLGKAKTAHGVDFPTKATTWKLTAPETSPFRELVTWDRDVALTIDPATAGQRWYHYASEKVTSGWTAVSGGVSSRAHSAYDPTFGVFVSDVADGDGLWTRLRNNTSTPTNPGTGEFGWSANVLYVHLADGSDPNTHVVEVAKNNYCWSVTEGGLVTLTGGATRGGRLACIRSGGSLAGQSGAVVARDMWADYGGTAGGFASGGTFTSLVIDGGHAYANFNDGVNAHGDVGNTGTITVTDLESAYNGDEGYSCHDDVVSSWTGGRLHHNASGGATHVTNSVVTMTGVEVDHNQRNNPTSGTVGDTGGINYMDATGGAVTGCDVHDNPAEGILIRATASATASGNESGTENGNGLSDNLSA